MPCSLATSGKYVAEKRLDRWTFDDFMGIYMGFNQQSWGFTWDFQQQFHGKFMGLTLKIADSTSRHWDFNGLSPANSHDLQTSWVVDWYLSWRYCTIYEYMTLYIYICYIFICYICIWWNMSNYINSIHVNSDVCMDHLMCWHSWWMDVDGGLHGDRLFDSRLVFHDWIQTSIWNWLVVLTIWKNISQWERLSHILWKINNVWTHQPGNFNIFSPNERPGA